MDVCYHFAKMVTNAPRAIGLPGSWSAAAEAAPFVDFSLLSDRLAKLNDVVDDPKSYYFRLDGS